MELQIQEIIDATQGKCLNPNKLGNKLIKGIFTDSRKDLTEGLFVPLIGENFDAHQYINQVYDKGALATLTISGQVVDDRLITIQVENTQKALLNLGKFYNQKFDRTIVAITGSVGKTTTKEMVATVLETGFNVHKTKGNFNNEIGLPLTLFQVNNTHEVSVLEMGMNHFGEIRNLSKTAQPDIAIITNIGTSHIENLGSREGILLDKCEIFEGLKPNGIAIINGDEPLLLNVMKMQGKQICGLVCHEGEWLSTLKDTGRWITYGLENTNDYYASNIVLKNSHVLATVHTPNETYDIEIPSPGEHMVRNALAGIAVAETLKLSKEDIIQGIKNYKSEKMRMQISECPNGITIIDDTYNASADSMMAALKVLEKFETQGRKIAILGDMFELGTHSEELHKRVGREASNLQIDLIYTVGDYAKKIGEGTKIATTHFNNKQLL